MYERPHAVNSDLEFDTNFANQCLDFLVAESAVPLLPRLPPTGGSEPSVTMVPAACSALSHSAHCSAVPSGWPSCHSTILESAWRVHGPGFPVSKIWTTSCPYIIVQHSLHDVGQKLLLTSKMGFASTASSRPSSSTRVTKSLYIFIHFSASATALRSSEMHALKSTIATHSR